MMKSMKRTIAVLVAVSLMVGCIIGGTLSWLTSQTNEVKNVFTTSDVKIKLEETTTDYKMIPGWTIDKNPRVTVESNSEDCYLFVQVDESKNLKLADYIAYEVDTATTIDTKEQVIYGGWIKGTGVSGDGVPVNVYYREVAKSTSDQVFAVLGSGTHEYEGVTYSWQDDEVLVLPKVTKDDMEKVTDSNEPTLTFKAYAIQLYSTNDTNAENGGKFTPKQAWEKAFGSASTGSGGGAGNA